MFLDTKQKFRTTYSNYEHKNYFPKNSEKSKMLES